MAMKSTPIVVKLEEKIMVLIRTEPTEEQSNEQQTQRESLQKSLSDGLKETKVMGDILSGLDLSPEPESKPEVKKSNKEEPNPEEEKEVVEDVEEEESTEEETSQEEEEVIPKSKVQKRFDELTAKNKILERRLEEMEKSREVPKDEITKQLESMTTEQLKAAKLEVRKAQIKAQDDDVKLNELLTLEDRINSVIQEAPANFLNAQKNAYIKKAAQIAESGEISNMEVSAPQIMKIAGDIYAEYPALQKDINGQAIALELAVKHFKAINSVPGDKAKETELKRQVNTLKRKTTLDTKTGKTNIDKSRLDTLKKNAIGGTMSQKVDLIRSHPMFNVDKMIPDEFK